MNSGLDDLTAKGCNLSISEENFESSEDKVLTIIGEISNIHQTLTSIIENCSTQTSPNGNPDTWFNPNADGIPERVAQKFGLATDEEGKKVFRCLVPAQNGGIIVGKKGAHMQPVKDLGAEIELHDVNAPYKVLRIKADNFEILSQSVDLMCEHLRNANKQDMNLFKEESIGFKMLVNNSIAGSLIGPKGAIVKEMKEETGCKVIKVNSDDVPGSTDKIVVILGEKESVVKAVAAILEKLEGQDIKGRERRLEYEKLLKMRNIIQF